MSQKKEYLEKIKFRSWKAEKLEKQKILDEFCQVCSYNGRYANRKLNDKDSGKHPREYQMT